MNLQAPSPRALPTLDSPGLWRIDALAVGDAAGTLYRPGSVLLRIAPGRSPALLCAGTRAVVDAHPAAQAASIRVLDRRRSVLLPGLVNAHTHLDLTHIGPREHDPDAGFVPWVDMIRSLRHTDDEAIAASVRRGIELNLAGGNLAIGDIAGAPAGRPSLTPWRTLRDSGVPGASYLEFFGIGRSLSPRSEQVDALVDAVRDEAIDAHLNGRARLGLQPHAPNTVDRRLYRRSVEFAQRLPGGLLCTHLAETIEERRFIASGDGPQRELLERFGLWDESILDELGKGEHPVKHLSDVLEAARLTAVHVNDATDEAIRVLSGTGASVVYCPRASTYFAAERQFGPHRYRDLIAVAVNVALGTDSIVNLPAPSARTPQEDRAGTGMSILDEMRLLHARDGTDAHTLLAMATINGAKAIGLDPEAFTFAPARGERGEKGIIGVIGVEITETGGYPIAEVLSGSGRPEVLCH